MKVSFAPILFVIFSVFKYLYCFGYSQSSYWYNFFFSDIEKKKLDSQKKKDSEAMMLCLQLLGLKKESPDLVQAWHLLWLFEHFFVFKILLNLISKNAAISTLANPEKVS